MQTLIIYMYLKESIQTLIIYMYLKAPQGNYTSYCSMPQIFIKKNYFFSLPYIKMSEKTINFRDKKINKKDFYNNKKPSHTIKTI